MLPRGERGERERDHLLTVTNARIGDKKRRVRPHRY